MKCVRLNNSRIVRVSDEEAERLWETREGSYAKKSEWRAQKRADAAEHGYTLDTAGNWTRQTGGN